MSLNFRCRFTGKISSTLVDSDQCLATLIEFESAKTFMRRQEFSLTHLTLWFCELSYTLTLLCPRSFLWNFLSAFCRLKVVRLSQNCPTQYVDSLNFPTALSTLPWYLFQWTDPQEVQTAGTPTEMPRCFLPLPNFPWFHETKTKRKEN